MADCTILLGSNLNDRLANIMQALDTITDFFKIKFVSHLYETEPFGYRFQGWFYNVAVRGSFSDNPIELLNLLKRMESEQGNIKRFQYAPRIIDADILTFENLNLATRELTIPHPLMQERKFVLLPLQEVYPDFVHPVSGKSIEELIKSCDDNSTVVRLSSLMEKTETAKIQ